MNSSGGLPPSPSRTIVVVSAGSPVELPWADDVDAVLLTWFGGQEAGHALADVLLGISEPGGRLPTTWPVVAADCPVLNTTPDDGVLRYAEGIFIGYRAWERSAADAALSVRPRPAVTPRGSTSGSPSTAWQVSVTVRNTGARQGREVVQIYVAPGCQREPGRPRPRSLAGGLRDRRGGARRGRDDQGRAAREDVPGLGGGLAHDRAGEYLVEAATVSRIAGSPLHHDPLTDPDASRARNVRASSGEQRAIWACSMSLNAGPQIVAPFLAALIIGHLGDYPALFAGGGAVAIAGAIAIGPSGPCASNSGSSRCLRVGRLDVLEEAPVHPQRLAAGRNHMPQPGARAQLGRPAAVR